MNVLPMKIGRGPGPSPSATSEATQRALVLVVDDHADTRELLRFVLEAHGYQVIEATDGDEAVRTTESARPNVIVMDSTLKHVDGLEATRRIRNIPAVSQVPIVFLSGHAQATARAAAMASGANDYLVKPVCIDMLEMTIDRQLEESGRIERKSWTNGESVDRKTHVQHG